MKFLLGLVVGIWIGCIGAACIVSCNRGAENRGIWAHYQRCERERAEEIAAYERVIAMYMGALGQ